MAANKEHALRFANVLQEQEVMSRSDAEKWLRENIKDLEQARPQKIGAILSYGYRGQYNKMWHKEDDNLVWGPGQDGRIRQRAPMPSMPSAPPVASASSVSAETYPSETSVMQAPSITQPPQPPQPQEPDLNVFDDPKEQFLNMCLLLGMQRHIARSVTEYVSMTADLDNPSEVWQALVGSRNLNPAARNQIYKAWTSHIKADVPDSVLYEMGQNGGLPTSDGRGNQLGSLLGANTRQRQWMVVDGKPIPTTFDDPLGVPFHEAVRAANMEQQRLDKDRARDGNAKEEAATGMSTVLAAMIKEQGETERKRMDVNLATQQAPRSTEPATATSLIETLLKTQQTASDSQRREVESRMESRDKEFTSRMDAIEKSHQAAMERLEDRYTHQMELMAQQHTHEMDLMNRIMEMRSQPTPSPFQMMDDIIPGMGQKMLETLTRPPASGPIIHLDGGDMEGMQGREMSLETYKAIDEIRTKRQMTRLAIDTIPELIKTGKDLAEATRRAREEIEQPEPERETTPETPVQRQPKPQETHMVNRPCVNCHTVLALDAAMPVFVCEECYATQTRDGKLILPRGYGRVREPAQEPAQEPTQEPADEVVQEEIAQEPEPEPMIAPTPMRPEELGIGPEMELLTEPAAQPLKPDYEERMDTDETDEPEKTEEEEPGVIRTPVPV